MIAALRELTDRVLGRGEAAITVPPFDGALKPNQLLEEAIVVAELDAPEDLATDGRSLFVSDGSRLLRLDGSQLHEAERLDSTMTALACLSDGGFAIALEGKEVRIRGGKNDGKRWQEAAGQPFFAINALAVTPNGKLIATDGSARHSYNEWCHDLIESRPHRTASRNRYGEWSSKRHCEWAWLCFRGL